MLNVVGIHTHHLTQKANDLTKKWRSYAVLFQGVFVFQGQVIYCNRLIPTFVLIVKMPTIEARLFWLLSERVE